MNCTDIRPLISSYHDGDASRDEIAEVEKHLATCPDCRRALAEYRAIGGGLRAMAVPVPPAGLRRDVWRAIEANGHGAAGAVRPDRRANVTVPKGGKAAERETPLTAGRGWGWGRVLPASGLVAVLALAFAAVLLFTNRTTVAAANLLEKSPISDYNQTLHVQFSRVVSPSDVIANTSVQEVEGNSTSAVSNVIKTYSEQSRVLTIAPKSPWTAGSQYTVIVDASKIHTNVGDQTLGTDPIKLSFSALAYTPTATATSTNTPTATATRKPTQTPRPTNTPLPTAIAQNTEVVPPPAVNSPTQQAQPSNTPTVARPSDTPRPSATASSTATPRPTDTRTPEPTNTPLPATATATSTPGHKATPSATATPRITSTPRASMTPTPRATVTPTPLSNCSIQPVNGFGKLWKDNASVRSRLGCPSAGELGIQLSAEQHFQGGYMFWRGDTKSIYVFLGGNTGQWYEFEDTWQDGDPTPEPVGGAPAGLYEPVRGFGKIWHEYPGLRQSLGWATDQETNITAAWEAFKGGNMIWTGSDHLIHVLYDDSADTYETYRDTFGTPVPSIPRPGE